MKLVFGLGNPEARYSGTRHNVGFAVLDNFARAHDVAWKNSPKFKALTAEITVGDEKILLIKPTTYYNLVGESARALIDFYKIEPIDVLIIHDDLALPLGTIRTRHGGSDGGNNGLKSLAAHIGSGTYRLRIGVWSEMHEQAEKTTIVLGDLSKQESGVLAAQKAKISSIISAFCTNTFDATTVRST